MVESRVTSLGLRKGTLEASKELSLVTTVHWLPPATPFFGNYASKCQVPIGEVGDGRRGQAGKRRQWARREEEQARLEREAQWLEKVSGRNLSRRGDFPSL